MRCLFALVSVFLFIFSANAQNDTISVKESESKVAKEDNVKLYGFIRNYLIFDSRKNLQSGADQFNQIPMDLNLNALGEDLNDVPSMRFLASTTRLGLDFVGPKILGAASSAKIEADFNAYSGTTMLFRFRQAFMKLDWGKSNLLVGQAWHPMAGDMLPNVISLASGSPFNPFSRTPQIRYNYKVQDFTLSAAAFYQYQYTSVGPNGASFEYAKYSMLPEFYAEVKYQKNGFMATLGLDFLQIAPRSTGTVIVETESITTKVYDRVSGFSPIVSLSYTKDKFSFQMKSVYAQNTAHLSMMSGYGVTKQIDNGSREYAPLRSSSSWMTIGYGRKYKVVLFLGYSKNLGASENFVSTDMLYVRGYKNIDQMYRISPVISYNLKHFNLGLEFEHTTVAYGNTNLNGTVSNTHNVSNNRACFMVKYNF